MLEKRIITLPQQHWLSKLMVFDFAVAYRPGKKKKRGRCFIPPLGGSTQPCVPLHTPLASF
jgi:hypothetical protein